MKGVKDKNTGRFMRSSLPKKCSICESQFKSYDSKQKTCSRKCGSVLRLKNNPHPNKGMPRSADVRAKISASHVGIKPSKETIEKMRLAKLGKPAHNKGKPMSEATKLKLSLQRRGENSPAWKGGLTSLIRQIRRGIKYRTWRKAVYDRDNYTCQVCGEDKQYLNADHIIQFALLLRMHNIKTVEQAESSDALWDIGNGRTLCLPCHKTTDTYLNKGKQYLKQYGL